MVYRIRYPPMKKINIKATIELDPERTEYREPFEKVRKKKRTRKVIRRPPRRNVRLGEIDGYHGN